jgi:ferric-dicitrate binding protein FerR (iron transport regulator)
LNAGSTLSYPAIFKGDQRKVKLEGEAYFEVAKDARHPFVVNADSVDIKVLGTHFNVSAYAEESQVTTTLIEGSVSISKINTEGEMILKPDQQAVYDKKAGNVQLKQVDSKAFAAWREGQYLFEHENFGNIVKKLERGFNVKIAIKSESLKNEVFSGQFDHVESVGQLLNMMKQHRNFDYKIYGNQIDIFQYVTLQKTNN